jgi:hypothetical protein
MLTDGAAQTPVSRFCVPLRLGELHAPADNPPTPTIWNRPRGHLAIGSGCEWRYPGGLERHCCFSQRAEAMDRLHRAARFGGAPRGRTAWAPVPGQA